MNGFKFFAFTAVVGICLTIAAPITQAQVSVEIGAAPVCPYGYYDVPPYNCAPYGYYGPEWFANGVFIGAGPWFHGPDEFRGHVDNRFHPEHGYRGPLPNRGDRAEEGKRVDRNPNFRGNEMRDGRGHAVDEGRH
ncbi:MAG: hypothetical protein WA718_07310 [Terriglobales bacterium]